MYVQRLYRYNLIFYTASAEKNSTMYSELLNANLFITSPQWESLLARISLNPGIVPDS